MKNNILIDSYSCDKFSISENYSAGRVIEAMSQRYDINVFCHESNKAPHALVPDKKWKASYFPSNAFLESLHKPLFKGGYRADQICYDLNIARYLKVHKGFLDDIRFIHILTFNYRYPSLLSYSKKPFIVGPVGGGLTVPKFLASGIKEPLISKLKWIDTWRFYMDPLMVQTYDKAKFILINSSSVKEILPQSWHDKFIYIGEGVDTEQWKKNPADAHHTSVPVILSVGRLVAWKGVGLLLEACQAIKRKRGDLQFNVMIAGDGPELANYSQAAEKYGLQDQVTFLGMLPKKELLKLYSQADIFCLPSVKETFGQAAVEAMSCSLPVVVLDRGGPSDTVSSEAGFKIKVLSKTQIISDLVDALIKLLDNEQMRLEMGRRARQHVVENYSWEAVANRLSKVYDTILSEK